MTAAFHPDIDAWHAHRCPEGGAPHSVRSTGCCDRGGATCRRRRAARHSARFSPTLKEPLSSGDIETTARG
jgi:hypothetical protein